MTGAVFALRPDVFYVPQRFIGGQPPVGNTHFICTYVHSPPVFVDSMARDGVKYDVWCSRPVHRLSMGGGAVKSVLESSLMKGDFG